MIIIFALAIHYDHPTFVLNLDYAWRCTIYTAFWTFIAPLLQIIRLVYAVLAPLFNMFAVIYYQIIQASLVMFFKCSVSSIFEPVEPLARAIIDVVLSFISWFGLDDLPLTSENNWVVNDFVIVPAASNVMRSIGSTKKAVMCICEDAEPLWNIIYGIIDSPHIPLLIDHSFQMLVRVFQMAWRIIIPPQEFPRLDRILYHLWGSILEIGFLFDYSLEIILKNLIIIFSIGNWSPEKINLPAEFIFTSGARTAIAGGQFVTRIFMGIINLFVPLGKNDIQATLDSFNLDESISNLWIGMYDFWNTVHWVVYAIENVIVGSIDKNIGIKPMPVELNCDWTRDLFQDRKKWPQSPHMISYTLACTGYSTFKVGMGSGLWGYNFVTELFFKSIIVQEQNVLRLIQKYDGVWSNRDEINNCAARKRRAEPHNGLWREDWTIDPIRCQCDMNLGLYVAPDPNHPYGEFQVYNRSLLYKHRRRKRNPVFNPWCGQPTMQDNFWNYMDEALIYATHGIFGPSGIGEILQQDTLTPSNFRQKVQDELDKASKLMQGGMTTQFMCGVAKIARDMGKNIEVKGCMSDKPKPEGEAEAKEKDEQAEGSDTPKESKDEIDEIKERLDVLEDSEESGNQEEAELNKFNPKMFMKKYTRQTVEIMRIGLRTLLTVVDLFMGSSWLDMNCGYGLNKTALKRRWLILNTNSTSEEIKNWNVGQPEFNETIVIQQGEEWKIQLNDDFNNIMSQDDHDKILRWDVCRERGYDLPTMASNYMDPGKWNPDNVKLGSRWCRGSNDNRGCVCNPMFPLDVSMPCQCIPFPPKPEDLMEETPLTKQLIDNRIKRGYMRWCGSMINEWYFQNINKYVDAMAWIASFGPWNTDCVPTNMITKDTDMSSYYIFARTSVGDRVMTNVDSYRCEAFDSFGEDDNEDEVTYEPSRLAGVPVGRQSTSWKSQEEALINGYTGGSVSKCPTSDPTMLTEQARGSCIVYGNVNMFCNIGIMIRSLYDIEIKLKRAAARNFQLLFAGNFFDWDLDLEKIICARQKVFGAIASNIGVMFSFGLGKSMIKAIGKLYYGVFIYTVKEEAIVAAIFTFVVSILEQLLLLIARISPDGNAMAESMGAGISNLGKVYFGTYLDPIVIVMQAFGDFLTAMCGLSDMSEPAKCGAPIYGIADVVKIVAKLVMTFGAMIFTFLFKVFFSILQIFGDPAGGIKNFLGAFVYFVEMLLQNLPLFLKAILQSLGPIGDVISGLLNIVCEAITSALKVLTAGAFNEPGFCNAFKSSHPHVNSKHHLSKLFTQHTKLAEESGMHFHHWASHHLNWNGTSKCDIFMTSLKYMNTTDLRPLEIATFSECYELYNIGELIENQIGIPELKIRDILYNWHRKWGILYEGSVALYALIVNIIHKGSFDEKKFKKDLTNMNIKPRGWIKVKMKLDQAYKSTMKLLKDKNFYRNIFKYFDEDFDKEGSASLTHDAWKLGSDAHEIYTIASFEWEKKRLGSKFRDLWTYSNHITDGFTNHVLPKLQTKHTWFEFPHTIRTGIKTLGDQIKKSKITKVHRMKKHRKLRKPLNVDITINDTKSILCPDPDSELCFRCTIIDNLFELIRDHGVSYGRWMSGYFAPPAQDPACCSHPENVLEECRIDLFTQEPVNAPCCRTNDCPGLTDEKNPFTNEYKWGIASDVAEFFNPENMGGGDTAWAEATGRLARKHVHRHHHQYHRIHKYHNLVKPDMQEHIRKENRNMKMKKFKKLKISHHHRMKKAITLQKIDLVKTIPNEITGVLESWVIFPQGAENNFQYNMTIIFEEIPNLNKNKCQLKTTVNKIANVTTWLAAASPDASALDLAAATRHALVLYTLVTETDTYSNVNTGCGIKQGGEWVGADTLNVYSDRLMSAIVQRFKLVEQDWINLFDILVPQFDFWLGYTLLNITTWGTNHSQEVLNGQTDKFITATTRLFTETENNYVDFYGYSITYLVSQAIVGVCDVEMSIWVEDSTQAQRIDRMDAAFMVCLILSIVILSHTYWSPISLSFIANIMILIQFNVFLWMFMTYGYMPSCAPLLPYTLSEDVIEWIFLRIAPGCFCSMFPNITSVRQDCQLSTCHACGEKPLQGTGEYDIFGNEIEEPIPWPYCQDQVPLMKELGIFWNWPFLLRWQVPESIAWLAETDLIYADEENGYPHLYQLTLDAFENPTFVSDYDIECYNLTILNLVASGFIFFFFVYILIYLTAAIVSFTIDVILWFWQLILLLKFMATGIEQSAAEEPPETEDE